MAVSAGTVTPMALPVAVMTIHAHVSKMTHAPPVALGRVLVVWYTQREAKLRLGTCAAEVDIQCTVALADALCSNEARAWPGASASFPSLDALLGTVFGMVQKCVRDQGKDLEKYFALLLAKLQAKVGPWQRGVPMPCPGTDWSAAVAFAHGLLSCVDSAHLGDDVVWSCPDVRANDCWLSKDKVQRYVASGPASSAISHGIDPQDLSNICSLLAHMGKCAPVARCGFCVQVRQRAEACPVCSVRKWKRQLENALQRGRPLPMPLVMDANNLLTRLKMFRCFEDQVGRQAVVSEAMAMMASISAVPVVVPVPPAQAPSTAKRPEVAPGRPEVAHGRAEVAVDIRRRVLDMGLHAATAEVVFKWLVRFMRAMATHWNAQLHGKPKLTPYLLYRILDVVDPCETFVPPFARTCLTVHLRE